MELGIARKVALIAGGGKDMGRWAGEMLPQAGAAVAITAPEVDRESFDEMVNGVLAQGGRAVGAADRTVKEDIDGISFIAGAETAEGGRLALVCDGRAVLADGHPHQNTYHCLITVQDGMIQDVRDFAIAHRSAQAFRRPGSGLV